MNKETTRIVIISSVLFTELFLHFQLKKNLAAGERTEDIKKKDIRQTDNQALEDGHSGLKVHHFILTQCCLSSHILRPVCPMVRLYNLQTYNALILRKLLRISCDDF